MEWALRKGAGMKTSTRTIPLLAVCVALSMLISLPRPVSAPRSGPGEIRVLMMMGDHVGGYHYFTSDVWEQHGWDLTTSGLVPTPDPCGLGVPFNSGALITQITDLSGYDCLAIMQTQAWDGNSHDDLLAGPDYGQGVRETNEGDYVLAGYTMSFGGGREDVYLLKIDADGDTIWVRTYGGSRLDEAKSVCYTSDGHIAVAGQTESFGAGRSDVYLLKVYTLGNMVWENNCGSSTVYREEYGKRAFGLAETGVAATGWRTDQDNGDPCQAAFLRTSLVGSLRRHLKYSDPYIEHGTSICQVADEGLLICGAKDETTHKNDLLLIRRIPGTGCAWSQSIGGDGSDWGCSALEIEPGHYVIAGYTESPGSGSFDGWLLKMREADAAVPAALRFWQRASWGRVNTPSSGTGRTTGARNSARASMWRAWQPATRWYRERWFG